MNKSQNKFQIKKAEHKDISTLLEISKLCDSIKPAHYFDVSLKQRDVFIMMEDMNPVGYAMLNWSPRYSLYKRLDIPEIQDINIIPECRRQGRGEAFILYLEEVVRQGGRTEIGIGVGLHSGFGAAQRLYCRLGYLPDGNGVVYDRETITPHSIHPVDDDLCLMMIKKL